LLAVDCPRAGFLGGKEFLDPCREVLPLRSGNGSLKAFDCLAYGAHAQLGGSLAIL
jgi:hypothetical protein